MALETTAEGVLSARSPATNLEVRLLELSPDGTPSLGRTLAVFGVFDEVLPHSGVFQRVLRMVRDELFESVFSDQYSSRKQEDGTSSTDRSVVPTDDGDPPEGVRIGRIPYFTLIQTLLGQRDEASELLHNEIVGLREMLSEKATALERSQAEREEARRETERIKKVVADRDELIGRMQEQNTQLQEDMAFLQDTSTLEKRRLTFEINRLQEKIDSLEKDKVFLETFKQGYDSMHDAFIFRPGEDSFTLGQKRSRKPVMASKKNQLMTNIQAARKLEEQLLEVQNQCVSEFDSYLERHRQSLQSTLADSSRLAQLDVELNETQDRFTHTIDSLQEELGMIRQHVRYLQSELESITAKPAVPKPPSRVGPPQPLSRVAGPLPPADRGSSVNTYGKQSQTSGKDSILSSAENFENVDLLSGEMDPFIPQEAVLSKYSIMVYTSTNGRESFNQLMDAKFCPSCCETTVVCPHKVTQEKIITLPHNCTHIKLTRPKIKIPAGRKQRSSTRAFPPSRGRGHTTVNDILGAGRADLKVLGGRPAKSVAVEPFHKDSVTPGMRAGLENTGTPVVGTSTTPVKSRGDATDSTLEHTQNPLFMIWDDYIRRTDITRSVPVPMSIQQCLSLIGQFYARILWSDEQAAEADRVSSVVDYLYHFFEDRYMVEEVIYLCMHDFISAIIEYSSVSKHIQLFCHVAVGNLDAATFRYLLVVGDLIDRVTWETVRDFKVFIRLLYPFLNGTPILSFIDERSGDHTDSGTQTSPERVIRTPPRRKRKPVKRKHSLEREQPRGSQNMPSAPPDPERPTTPPAQERPAAPPAQEVLDEEEVHAFLDSQTEEDLRALLLDLLRRHPDEWDHLTGHPEGGEEQEAIPSDGESEGGPDWCHCGNCREMPTEVESVCCRRRNGPCVTAEQQFRNLILDPTALDLAMVQRYDLLALGDRADNTSYRYTAYRSYVYWKSGRTGRYNRIVIPSCAVWAIRDRFPSEDGHYTGFRIGRF